jgi:hypothetical protein
LWKAQRMVLFGLTHCTSSIHRSAMIAVTLSFWHVRIHKDAKRHSVRLELVYTP